MAESSNLDPGKKSKADSFFAYGNDAALKSNFDYAISMYREALKLDPANLQYRQALRGVQRRAFGNEPSKVGRLVGARIQPIKLGMKTAKGRGKWIDVLEGCEDIFKLNPWDINAAEDAADAAASLNLHALAQWYMESVLPQAGDTESFFLHMAKVYEQNQVWDRAIFCWEKVGKINPNNEESRRKVRSLSASATISRSGLQGSLNKHNEAAAPPTAEQEKARALAEAEELRRASQTPEERLLKEIEDHPAQVGLYLQLVDLYKSSNKLDDAEKVLTRGRKAVPEDNVLKTTHADIQLLRLRRAIDSFTKRVRDNPDDIDAPVKLGQLKEKLASYELGEYRRRAEANPEDAALRLKYGKLLAMAGKHDEAIAEFQQARSNPDLKVEALFQSGQSFEAKNLPKLAERNLQEALRLADPSDRNLFNELHYHLGKVAEAQGNFKGAEEHYNEVAAEDYTYRDVADRLRDLNKKTS